ncbi:hypothetical protein DdX_15448 [Ditylenchus destructor]|uniref:Uncharacterized protein n=1 Tax=Ditylenchus destructor TaxID=166010 RepID=A0AAD4MSA0_9BILA|nr:hypothetical protein DdX_15448 [Ditylenchus destructor]
MNYSLILFSFFIIIFGIQEYKFSIFSEAGNAPAGRKIPSFHRVRRQQTVITAPSAVDAAGRGIISISPGSVVEFPPESVRDPTPGVLTNPSVVHTPIGLQSIPGGSKIVPPGIMIRVRRRSRIIPAKM